MKTVNYQDWLVTEMLQKPSYMEEIDKVVTKFLTSNKTPQEAIELGEELRDIYNCAEMDHESFPCSEECCLKGDAIVYTEDGYEAL